MLVAGISPRRGRDRKATGENRPAAEDRSPTIGFSAEGRSSLRRIVFYQARRIASYHGIGRYVLGHHRVGGDDCAVAYLHAGHDNTFSADPHVIPDNKIPLKGQLSHVIGCTLLP